MNWTFESYLNLATLSGLEIVLGVDNVIFIALLVAHLAPKDRARARFIGLSLALFFRVAMLFGATWIMKLTTPLFDFMGKGFSGKSLLLIFGGLFLVVKSILELFELFKDKEQTPKMKGSASSKFAKIISQIIFIDIVLSLDSIITAVGMTNDITIIIIAMVIAMISMLVAAKTISDFIYTHTSVKVIGISFIWLVGAFLTLAGFDIEIEKGYLYFAMFFCCFVETMNILLKKQNKY